MSAVTESAARWTERGSELQGAIKVCFYLGFAPNPKVFNWKTLIVGDGNTAQVCVLFFFLLATSSLFYRSKN